MCMMMVRQCRRLARTFYITGIIKLCKLCTHSRMYVYVHVIINEGNITNVKGNGLFTRISKYLHAALLLVLADSRIYEVYKRLSLSSSLFVVVAF